MLYIRACDIPPEEQHLVPYSLPKRLNGRHLGRQGAPPPSTPSQETDGTPAPNHKGGGFVMGPRRSS